MNTMHSSFNTCRWLRRPKANPMPIGKLRLMPATASSRLSIIPPQKITDTGSKKGTPGIPRSNTMVNKKAETNSIEIREAVPKGV